LSDDDHGAEREHDHVAGNGEVQAESRCSRAALSARLFFR
jgi:hypothetical protein